MLDFQQRTREGFTKQHGMKLEIHSSQWQFQEQHMYSPEV